MREAEFRAWFEANDYDGATIGTQLARAKRIEQSYGDLDELYSEGKLAALKSELSYSTSDERANRPNPAKFPVNGNIRNSMASYCSTIEYYSKFCAAADGLPLSKEQDITADAIEAAMDEFDAIGLEGFKSQYGFGTPQKYWVKRSANGKLYPAKAVVGISHGYVPGGAPLKASDFYGGQGEQAANGILRKLGYEIVEKGGSDNIERPFLLYDTEGQEYQPTRTYNRQTGASAFRLQRPGTSNRTEDAEEVENTIDFARAMLLDGRLARVKRTDGTGPANYIGYGKSKLTRYRLDAELARQIGVPPEGGIFGSIERASGDQEEKGAMPELATMPTNLILYGPPGTGKTYNTALEAVKLCDGIANYPETIDGRAALMKRYNELQRKGRIGFVTFHQNFSYEDFVEGLRPQQAEVDEEGKAGSGFSLVPRDGVFKQISKVAAENKGQAVTSDLPPMDGSRKIFKMSLGRSWSSDDDVIFENALSDKYVVLGWGGNVDWSDLRYDHWEEIKKRWRQDHPDASGNDPNMSQMYTFRANMEIGSIIIISDGNMKFRAIAEITGPYQYDPGPDGEYNHRRSVRWLWHSSDSLPRERIYRKSLSQVSAYQMRSAFVEWEALGQIISSSGDAVATSGEPEPYVLIIDEINRANVSKVFGELITLIEPDKRAGMANALSVKLPYSGEAFSVPANLNIIGTMNTADRSIAQLDTALRRRFNFREMAPDPALLTDASKRTGIDLVRVLTTINQRIEYLIDREHRIGHAFFINCETAEQVHAAMRDKVIPLLQEYFFEDWSRIHAVLGDGFIREDMLDPPPGIEGDRLSSWSVLAPFRADAFDRLAGQVMKLEEDPGE
ncbi:DNA polymerase III delta prime subunit [Sphingobium fontiphilum]|uniref:DNA polymerase III delta prime subunit n=1 Tax=Sphingobium fontiphilum TaxID=944425 RepID=A0A7W6DDG7_9SPHN|nr:AAA family ATPase [Sphingobium fontiphilum]MBB3981158.1 DNA polymerase III delta prime subunit [Sphingobium fontiphilum]